MAWYFPKEDAIEYAYVSPTAFYHEYGVVLPDPDDKRDIEPEKKRKIIWVDLKKKILIFLDQPHDILLQRLRPLLSHDRKMLVSKITDPQRKGGMRTKTVVIQGYPTVIFCTAKFSMEDQERTRLLLLSPETSREKIKAAIELRIRRESDREAFHDFMESYPKRVWLKRRVEEIARSGIEYVIIPEELQIKIRDRFFKLHEKLIPRHQRDVGRLLALIKAHALLNLWSRQSLNENSILVNEEDVEEGFRIYEDISKANELGLPPEVYNVYEALKSDFERGITRKDVQALYYKNFHRIIGKKRLEEFVNLLLSTGLIAEEPDPEDHRQKRLVISQGVYISQDGKEAKEPQKTLFSASEINTPRPMTTPIGFSSETCEVCEVCGAPSVVTLVRNGVHRFCARCRDDWQGNL